VRASVTEKASAARDCLESTDSPNAEQPIARNIGRPPEPAGADSCPTAPRADRLMERLPGLAGWAVS